VRGIAMSRKFRVPLVVLFLALVTHNSAAAGSERLCDSSVENCQGPLLDLIRAETVGIDVAFWFMEDDYYVQALIERWRAGVPVRVIMDTEANVNYPLNKNALDKLKAANIPMREKVPWLPEWCSDWAPFAKNDSSERHVFARAR
jgi:hypothetical protein